MRYIIHWTRRQKDASSSCYIIIFFWHLSKDSSQVNACGHNHFLLVSSIVYEKPLKMLLSCTQCCQPIWAWALSGIQFDDIWVEQEEQSFNAFHVSYSTISEKVGSTVCIMRCMRRSLIDVLTFDKSQEKSIRSNGKLSRMM